MKKQISKFMKNKTPFAFVIKILILVGVSYFLIQLSNEAKRLEERKHIPDLQNPYDYALKYINKKYRSDWEKLGHTLYKADRFADYENIKMSVEIGVLDVYKIDHSFSPADFLISQDCRIGGEGFMVEISYGTIPQVEIGRRVEDEYISYDILYENGEYVRNQEMEEYFGITTDEVIEWAESSQHAFEEELRKMHVYQIGKARKRRGILTNIGLIAVLLYIRQKWRILVDRIDKEDKPTEQCLGEIIVNAINKFIPWRWVLCGAAMLFWIYILRPVISSFILFEVKSPANIYTSYGMSAVVVAIAGRFITSRYGMDKPKNRGEQMNAWKMVQMAAGCILEMFIIRLGIGLVSDFYSYNRWFYIVNGITWCGTVFLIFMLGKIKYLIVKEKKI